MKPYYEQYECDSTITTRFKITTGLKTGKDTLLKYKPDNIHMAKQKFCVCHHCEDGQNAKVELELMEAKIHLQCEECSRDAECNVEKKLPKEEKEKIKDVREKVIDYLEHKEIADH